MKANPINADDLISAYVSGESEQSIASRLHVNRRRVRRFLVENGVAPRGRTAANRLLASQRTPEENRRLATYAFTARRGVKESMEARRKRAFARQTQEWLVGAGERQLAEWLKARGLDAQLQYPVDGYNLDIAIAPVAVEVRISDRNPLSAMPVRQRIKHLTNLGWHVVYVWVTSPGALIERTADHIVAFVEEAKRDPSPIGQYRVIWGASEVVAAGRGEID